MKKLNRLIRPVLLMAASFLAYTASDTQIWLALILLAAFYVAVDLFNADTREEPMSDVMAESMNQQPGRLGEYVIDSTNSYGLFLDLKEHRVFIDIRRDSLLKDREKYAVSLYENRDALEDNLKSFLLSNPEYSSKHIVYIGVHSAKHDEGEVFWEPDGYTKLRGLLFSPN